MYDKWQFLTRNFYTLFYFFIKFYGGDLFKSEKNMLRNELVFRLRFQMSVTLIQLQLTMKANLPVI